MAIAVKGSVGTVAKDSKGPITLTLPTHASGDLLVAFAYQRAQAASATALSLGTATGWTAIGTLAGDTTYGALGAWYKIATSSSETNPVITGNTTTNYSIEGFAVVLTGSVTSGSPIDAAGTYTTFAAPSTPYDVTSASLDTATDNAWVVTMFGSNDDNTWSVQTAGWTALVEGSTSDNTAGTDESMAVYYKAIATHGASGTMTSRQSANGGDSGTKYVFAIKVNPNATVTGLTAVAGVAAVPSPTKFVTFPAATVVAVAAVPAPTPRVVVPAAAVVATASVPDVPWPRAPEITNDAGITDAGQSVESGEWVGPWWPATVPVIAAIPEVTVSTTGGGDATVTGLSAVAGVAAVPAPLGLSAGLTATTVAGTAAVPAPTPRVLVAAAAVAGVAAVPAPLGLSAGLTSTSVAGVAAVAAPLRLSTGLTSTSVAGTAAVPAPLRLSTGLSATTVAGVTAVPAPLGLSAGLTAATVAGTATVPTPTPSVLVIAAAVVGVATVPTPTPSVAVAAASVAGVGTVPAPLGISAGLSADVVVGVADVPAPESITTASGLEADADLAAGTSLEAEALLSGLTAVAVTATATVPAVGVSTGLTATTVVTLGAVPSVALSAGLTASVVAGAAAVPTPLRLSAGLSATTVAGVAAVPAPAGLSAGLRAVTVAGVADIPLIRSPRFVTDDAGVTDAGQSTESGQWTGPWWPATVLAFAAVPAPTAVGAVATQDATVTDLSAVAGVAAISTPGVSAGLTAAVVVAVATVPAPLGLSAGLSATVVAATAAVPDPVLRVTAPAVTVVSIAAVSAPAGISAGLSPSTVAGAAEVPAPAGITAESASSVTADLVAGTGLVADAAITALTAVAVAATAAIPTPVPSVAVAATAVVATAAVPTVGLSVGLSASAVVGVSSVPAPLGISAGLLADVVAGVADVPAPVAITAQVSPVIVDEEGITDAGQTIDRATGVTDSATASEASTALNRGYEGADSFAQTSTAALGVAVAGAESGTLAESVQVDAEGLQTFEDSDSATLGEETALGFTVETSDDAGVTEDEWESYSVTEIPDDDTGLADSYFIEPSASDLGTLVDGPYTLNIPSSVSDVVGTLSESTTLQIGDLRGVTSTDQHTLIDVAAIGAGPTSVDSALFTEGAVVLERSSDATDEVALVEETTTFEFLVEAGDGAALDDGWTALIPVLDQDDSFTLSVETADAGPKGFYADVDSATLAEDASIETVLAADDVATLDDLGALDQGYASADSATIVEVAVRGFVQDVDDALDLTDEPTPEIIGSTEVDDSDSATLDESTDLVTGTEQTGDDSATLTEDSADLFYEIPVEDLAVLAESVAIEVLLVAVDAGVLLQFTSLFGPEEKPYARNGRAVLLPSPGMAPVLSTVGGRAWVTTMSGRTRVISGPGKVQVQSVPSIYTRADEP